MRRTRVRESLAARSRRWWHDGRGVRRGGADPLSSELQAIRDELEASVRAETEKIELVHPSHRFDAVNLCHYLALRRHDVRALQRQLSERGLSSLGRCEPHVMATVLAVSAAAQGRRPGLPPDVPDFKAGRAALDANADALFGPRPEGRVPRIMVTLPTEAADDYGLVRCLVSRGMDIARINGAHDGPGLWEKMADNVEKAVVETHRSCRISVDLPGPKLRTGPLEPGPRVSRLRPERDLRGVAVTPASVMLAGRDSDAGAPGAVLPVDPTWVERRRLGDRVDLVDTRGSTRRLFVVATGPGWCRAEVWDTTYVVTGTVLSSGEDRTIVGLLPEVEQFHVLRPGDVLRVTRESAPARPWRAGIPGTATLGCTLPEALSVLRVGHRVLLDDGKITGAVERVCDDHVDVRVLIASSRGSRLRSGKGINLPDTDLDVPIVTAADRPLLEFVARRADMVALSFLRHEGDIEMVREELRRVSAGSVPLILKIETAQAFHHLPDLLLEAMRSPTVGVMIARGDLAVEGGYPRLAEVQEEILWLCEAAHLPVIWATEVLDKLARTGRPSRAEVTDAAMAQQAECIMLNKGPHVDMAIAMLDDILMRMAGHQRKKIPILRPLRSWM
ncbi:MAG: pyruvate kinase [Acidimicrobiales bacterium]